MNENHHLQQHSCHQNDESKATFKKQFQTHERNQQTHERIECEKKKIHNRASLKHRHTHLHTHPQKRPEK